MNPATPSPSFLLKCWAHTTRVLLWVLVAAWLLLTLAWGGLHLWIVPRIGDFRLEVESRLSAALGVAVQVGELSAQSNGWVPSLTLHDLRLLDAQGRVALRLPRVLASFSPRSLVRMGFEQVYIDQPVLDVRRRADGRLLVAGLDFLERPDDGGTGADWFFSQTEWVVHAGTVHWTDETRSAPPLMLTQVDALVRNSLRGHRLRLDASPPPAWGERFTVRAVFRQPLLSKHAGRWQNWDGQVYAAFSHLDLSALHRYADLGAELGQGRGGLRLWADASRGEWSGLTADLALEDVQLQLAPTLAPLELHALRARLSARRLRAGYEFATEGLQFASRDGLTWPGGNVFISHTDAQGQTPARSEWRANQLDLAAMAGIASSLPLATPVHAQLTAYAPQGLVESLQARWEGALDAPHKLQLKGRVSGFGMAAQAARGAVPALPGVRGLSVDFESTESAGHAKWTIQAGSLELAGLLDEPLIPLQQLSAETQWSHSQEGWELRVSKLVFANADAQGQAQFTWRSEPAAQPGPGTLDLQASFSRADAARVFRYLPLSIAKSARDYVRDAVLTGQLSAASIKLHGRLQDFPFVDARRGSFVVNAQLQNLGLAYVPRTLQAKNALPWPALTQLAGQFALNSNRLELKGVSALVLGTAGLQLVRGEARIPDLLHAATVSVSADLKGPLSDALAVINGSPVGGWIGQALAKTVATGVADYRLRLTLPVQALDKARVQGSVQVAGSELQFGPDAPLLSGVKGAVAFSETGFTISAAQARLLGGELRFEGGSRAGAADEASVLLRGQGTVSAEGLRQARDWGWVPRLAASVSGASTYTAVLGFRRGQPELKLASSLQGMAINLPAPLNKAADAPLPVRYESFLLKDSLAPGQRLQEQLNVELGQLAAVTYVRDRGGAEARVLKGTWAVGLGAGESVPMPAAGVVANIQFRAINLDEWERVLGPLLSPPPPTSVPPSASPPLATGPRTSADAPRPAGGDSNSYLPNSLALRAEDVQLRGQHFHHVVAGGSRDGLTWRSNIDARELSGYIEYRQSAGAGAGRVYARLARWAILAGEESKVEAALEDSTASIPALDIVVEDMELLGKHLGQVEVEAVNRGAGQVAREGGVREWRLTKFNVQSPEAVFTATGNWSAVPGPAPARNQPERRQTQMNFKLDIADVGGLLKRLDMPGVIRAGTGKLEGQIAWMGSPLSLDYPSLGGQFGLTIENGQFLKVEPGLAKLIGVLSLQSLPRRLTLDFRDVFSEGFSFDSVRGDVKVEKGVASTNNLQTKGVNAVVLMEGSSDLARETQDIKVVVVPEVNAGTASLLTAVAINPVLGLSTLLAQVFLRRPLMQSITREYHIDGTWAKPRFTEVPRTPVAAKQESER